MAKSREQRLVLFGGTLVASILLGACAGDSPEAMQHELSSAVPTLAFVDQEQAPCAGQAILTAVGFEQLAAEGHSSELIAQNPTVVETIFTTHDSPDLREALNGCVDTNSLFRSQLQAQTGGDPLACDTIFSVGEPFVDDFLDSRFTDEDAAIEIKDSDPTRNMLRPCLSEAAFAGQFDIDLAADLGPAITEALPNAIAATECAGPGVVEHLGAEHLNELGVSVDAPRFTLEDLDLEAADQEAVTAAITECSDIDSTRRNELRSEEPSLGGCGMDALGETWKQLAVSAELGEGRKSGPQWILDDAIADCAVETAEAIVGRSITSNEKAAARNRATVFAVPFDESEDQYGATRRMLECAMFVAVAELGVDEFSATFDSLWYAETEEAAYYAMAAFGDLVLPTRRACEGDSIFAMVEIYRAGFSEETIECVERKMGGPEYVADLYERVAINPDASDADRNAYYVAVRTQFDSVADCYSSDEAGIYRSFQSWLNGVGFAEEPTESF